MLTLWQASSPALCQGQIKGCYLIRVYKAGQLAGYYSHALTNSAAMVLETLQLHLNTFWKLVLFISKFVVYDFVWSFILQIYLLLHPVGQRALDILQQLVTLVLYLISNSSGSSLVPLHLLLQHCFIAEVSEWRLPFICFFEFITLGHSLYLTFSPERMITCSYEAATLPRWSFCTLHMHILNIHYILLSCRDKGGTGYYNAAIVTEVSLIILWCLQFSLPVQTESWFVS